MDDKCQIRWDQISERDWGNALDKAGFVAYQQHYSYGESVKFLGGKVLRAELLLDGKLVGFAQVLEKKVFKFLNIFTCLRGPVWMADIGDDIKAKFYRELKKSLPRSFPKIAFIMPESDDAALLKKAKLKRVVSSYSTVMVDLRKSEEELLASMDGKWRNRLRAAEKSGLQAKAVSSKIGKYDWILQKEAEQAQRVGYRGLMPIFVKVFHELAGKDSIIALRVDEGGEAIAVVLLLIHGKSATYHIGWSNEQGKKLGAHNLLLWTAIRKLKQKNIEFLDLGGVSTEKESAGLARFKLGLCSDVLSLPGSYI